MKKILPLFVTIFLCSYTYAQVQTSAYTAVGKGVATTFLTDYQSLGVNPSALGWGTGYGDYRGTIGTSEMAIGISSPSLSSERLVNAANGLYGTFLSKDVSDVDFEKQREAAAEYAESGIAINANFNMFGASYQTPKLGGIAVAVRGNFSWNSELNKELTDIIFRGSISSYFDSLTVVFDGDTSRIANRENISEDTLGAVISGRLNNPILLSELTKGSSVKFLRTREFNIGYGRKIIGSDSIFAVYGGVGARFIQSIAMLDFESGDNGIAMYSALSPSLGGQFASLHQNNPNNFSNTSSLFPDLVGTGYGIDVAGSVILKNRIKFALAVNNMGRTTYTRNVYSVRDTLVGEVSLPGIAGDDITQALGALMNENGFITLQEEERYAIVNPALVRVGGSIKLLKKLEVGFDIIAPFNSEAPGSMQNSIVAFGGDFKPVKWLQLSAGYLGGGVYKHNIPVGINFILGDGSYEFGVSSQDALSFFLDSSTSVSAAFGFARIRF